MHRVLTVIIVPFLLTFILVRGLLRLLFVGPYRWLVRVSFYLGPMRFPFLLVFLPILIPGFFLDPRKGMGRMLDGDVICPTFTLPYAFERGPWVVCEN